jgi:hypothetical protein
MIGANGIHDGIDAKVDQPVTPGEKFQGHKAAEPGVFRFVDNSHASTTDLLNHSVVQDGLANHVHSENPDDNL